MIGRLPWILRRFVNRIWFRAGLYGLGAIAAVVLAGLGGPLVPAGIAERVNVDSIRDLLEVMASSMLLVATFSLGAMVAAFVSAANMATPRATAVLIEDSVSQNVLATFVGAFVFSIVALVAMSMGYLHEDGRVVLLLATSGMIVAVVATLFGWLDYLANMVRLSTIMAKIEGRASEALTAHAAAPFLGGRPLDGTPRDASPIVHDRTGYLAFLDVPALERIAREAEGVIYVARAPGALVEPSRPTAFASWAPDDDARRAILKAFTIRDERSLDQDPRYGLIVLSEIASRALSPGVNDPGTAIQVIGRLQRLLLEWAKARRVEGPPDRPHVHVPGLNAEDMFEDAFGPLARDGAPMIEVGMRLQKSLASLAAVGDASFAAAARLQSERALEHGRAALTLESDRARLADLADAVQGGPCKAGAA